MRAINFIQKFVKIKVHTMFVSFGFLLTLICERVSIKCLEWENFSYLRDNGVDGKHVSYWDSETTC